MCRPAFDGKPRGIGTGHHCRTGLVIDNLKEDSARPVFGTCVSKAGGNGDLRSPTFEIGISFDINTLYKRFRGNQELYRPVDASVMRPITGTPSRHHVLIEYII